MRPDPHLLNRRVFKVPVHLPPAMVAKMKWRSTWCPMGGPCSRRFKGGPRCWQSKKYAFILSKAATFQFPQAHPAPADLPTQCSRDNELQQNCCSTMSADLPMRGLGINSSRNVPNSTHCTHHAVVQEGKTRAT